MPMKPKQTALRLGAAAMSALLLAGTMLPAAAAVSPVVDEAYYGNLDYYGGLTEGSVVKSYRTNGNDVIIDRGTYAAVTNLTNRVEPRIEDGRVIFDLGADAPEHFYFQGETAIPYDTMPFRIAISYKMNGVETEPGDMAGQKGVGEITLKITPNENASAYQRDNFVLEAVTVMKDTDILSIEAPGAQVQKLGNLDTVLYAVLPGEEREFTLRIGSEDFSFSGFTFLLQPATLAQLDEIKELREAKEEMEDSYHAITGSLNEILDSLHGLDTRLNRTADGLDQLEQARAILSAGKNGVYDEADAMLASMTALSDSLEPVVSHLTTAKDALRESTAAVSELSQAANELRPVLQEMRGSIAAVQEDLKALNDAANAAKPQAIRLRNALSDLEMDMDELQEDTQRVESRTAALRTALGGLQKVSGLNPVKIKQDGENYTADELRRNYEQAQSLLQVCRYVAGATGQDLPTTEKGLAGFITENKAMIVQAAASQTADAAAKERAAAEAAKAGEKGTEAYQQVFDAVYAQVYPAALQSAAQTYEAKLSGDNPKNIAYLIYNWTDGDNVKSSLAEVDTFNGIIDDANDSISGVNAALNQITEPTSLLLSSLTDLLGFVDTNVMDEAKDIIGASSYLADTAASYDNDKLYRDSAALLDQVGTLLGRTDTVIGKADALSSTVTKYEPDAQSGIDDAITQVNASVELLGRLNSFTSTFENLMKAADPDLDAGTRKTLTGLSESLRQMGTGANAAESIRNASNTIQDLVEDKWDEYTGDKNNMLNMDSEAGMESFTSAENPAPASLQIVLRSQEIKVDEEARAAREAAEHPQSTLWDRILRMLRSFKAIFTGEEI